MRRTTWTWRRVIATLISLVVLLAWFSLVGFAVWFAIQVWPSAIGLVVVSALVLACAVSRPRLIRRPDGAAVSSAQAPTLFRLVDGVAVALGASMPDDVLISDDVNASTVRWGFRWRRAIVLGLPLCTAISGQQFVALVAHELAHVVNGDFARGYVVGTAQQTLKVWAEALHPGPFSLAARQGPVAVLTWVLLGTVALPVLGLHWLLFKVSRGESQRAELFADELAASVSGSTAVMELLDRVSFRSSITYAIERANREGSDPWQGIASRFDELTEAERSAMREASRLEAWSVDATHPPSHIRIEKIREAGDMPGTLVMGEQDWHAIQAELARFRPHVERSWRVSTR